VCKRALKQCCQTDVMNRNHRIELTGMCKTQGQVVRCELPVHTVSRRAAWNRHRNIDTVVMLAPEERRRVVGCSVVLLVLQGLRTIPSYIDG
jgi:hypothetical protein